MLGSKHFTIFGLLHLGHRNTSDLINICLQGLLASNFELRRNNSIKSFNTKSEEVYSGILDTNAEIRHAKGKNEPFWT